MPSNGERLERRPAHVLRPVVGGALAEEHGGIWVTFPPSGQCLQRRAAHLPALIVGGALADPGNCGRVVVPAHRQR